MELVPFMGFLPHLSLDPGVGVGDCDCDVARCGVAVERVIPLGSIVALPGLVVGHAEQSVCAAVADRSVFPCDVIWAKCAGFDCGGYVCIALATAVATALLSLFMDHTNLGVACARFALGTLALRNIIGSLMGFVDLY